MFKKSVLGLAVVSGLGVMSQAALAEGSVINVSLWDNGDMAMEHVDSMQLVMGSGADMSKATMGIKVDTDTVPAGDVTFVVTNASANFEHEMIVAPVASTDTPLPYNAETMRVDEDAAGSLGEVAELDTGESGSLTLHLDPGTYILYCNISGHYAMGMWTLFTVG